MSRYIAVFSSQPAHLLTLVQSLSPRVEVHPSGAVIVEVPSRYEQQAINQLIELNVASGRIDYGAADTRTAALFASRVRPGASIPSGQERDFLAPYSVQVLSLTGEEEIADEVLDIFFRWGVHSLGQLARLPSSELVSRLGEKGLRLQKLARGEDLRPFQAYQPQPHFEEKLELDWELEGLEPLAFALAGLLERLCQQLLSRGLATDRLHITLQLSNQECYQRSISLALPMRNPKTLLSLLRLKLQSDPPSTTIRQVAVRAHPARPHHFQHCLHQPADPNPEKLSRTLARLSALMGEENLGSPVLLDTHRPDAFRLEPFQQRFAGRACPSIRKGRSKPRPTAKTLLLEPQLVLRRIRPPLQTRISARQIAACAGPWRSSGDWWGRCSSPGNGQASTEEIDAWGRDEWDIEMVDGKVVRVYWDQQQKQWFLEGVYD